MGCHNARVREIQAAAFVEKEVEFNIIIIEESVDDDLSIFTNVAKCGEGCFQDFDLPFPPTTRERLLRGLGSSQAAHSACIALGE